MENCGYQVVSKAVTPIPFENIFSNKTLSDFLSSINMLFAKLLPGLFAYQFVYVFKIDPETESELMREKQLYEPYIDV